MQTRKAQSIATRLMRKHGLEATGWVLNWDNGKRRFGYCRHNDRTISLSKPLTRLNDEAQFTDTVLHEIAHALVDEGVGHRLVWQKKAKAIGAKPSRCYSASVVNPKGNYLRYCTNNCGNEHKLFRLRRSVRYNIYCGRCHRAGKGMHKLKVKKI